MSIPTFIDHLGDYERLTHNATHVLESVREAVVKQVRFDFFYNYYELDSFYLLYSFGVFTTAECRMKISCN